jgi:hypothetical protein
MIIHGCPLDKLDDGVGHLVVGFFHRNIERGLLEGVHQEWYDETFLLEY